MIQKIFVAFVYAIRLSPPGDGRDPRDFGAGVVAGSFSDPRKAYEAVELHAQHRHRVEGEQPLKWHRLAGTDQNTLFYSRGNSYSGYVTEVVLERRSGEERRR